MAKVEIRPARLVDADALAPVLRPADAAEIHAMQGQRADLAEAVRASIRWSSHAWTAHIDGEIAMVGGAAGIGSLLGGNIGSPWLLGCTTMFRRPGVLTRVGRRYVAFMHTIYPELRNHIDARNAVSIAWLQRLGFIVHTDAGVPMGPESVVFYPFSKRV